MGNKQTLGLFIILLLCTTYIFSFSHFGSLAYDSVMGSDDKFSEGTMIGSVSIEGMTRNDALQAVEEALTKWQKETTLTIKYREKVIGVNKDYFIFDVEKTVMQAERGQQNEMVVKVVSLEKTLTTLSSSLNSSDINMNDLESQMLVNAKMLQSGSYEVRLEPFLTNTEEKQAVINESKINLEETVADLEGLASEKMEVGSLAQFSLLQYLKDQKIKLSPLSLNKLATAIYEVALPTNFVMIERHISSELPEYAELGYEAKVDDKLQYDLIFSNPNEISYFIEFENVDSTLTVSLKGPEFLNRYEIKLEGKDSFKPKEIVQFNPQLSPAESSVKEEGKEGQIIKVYREHYDENGTSIKKETISEDFYPPIHRVVVRGLIQNKVDSTMNEEEDNDSNNETNDSSSEENEDDNKKKEDKVSTDTSEDKKDAATDPSAEGTVE
ncbi:G5 domain-containing protein [Niallia endozanthoxylica]|uniref:G5 domain-containing protein n=1 Tax=Niallia endozanthoxylica TaxID=2036016 RepID=A0A5J5HR81_9BACI|nr:G5 domain-containing protein [Niallia endozanthoxylica]KAA9023139.1 hypothetical protein F4V44_13645 [Niallia endozanthoxylica]